MLIFLKKNYEIFEKNVENFENFLKFRFFDYFGNWKKKLEKVIQILTKLSAFAQVRDNELD